MKSYKITACEMLRKKHICKSSMGLESREGEDINVFFFICIYYIDMYKQDYKLFARGTLNLKVGVKHKAMWNFWPMEPGGRATHAV